MSTNAYDRHVLKESYVNFLRSLALMKKSYADKINPVIAEMTSEGVYSDLRSVSDLIRENDPAALTKSRYMGKADVLTIYTQLDGDERGAFWKSLVDILQLYYLSDMNKSLLTPDVTKRMMAFMKPDSNGGMTLDPSTVKDPEIIGRILSSIKENPDALRGINDLASLHGISLPIGDGDLSQKLSEVSVDEVVGFASTFNFGDMLKPDSISNIMEQMKRMQMSSASAGAKVEVVEEDDEVKDDLD